MIPSSSSVSQCEKGGADSGTHPRFQSSKTNSADDKEALTQRDTLGSVEQIRKRSGDRRDTDREMRMSKQGSTSFRQAEEEKLWSKLAGHLVRGGSFEKSEYKFEILESDVWVMTEPRVQPWKLVAKVTYG